MWALVIFYLCFRKATDNLRLVHSPLTPVLTGDTGVLLLNQSPRSEDYPHHTSRRTISRRWIFSPKNDAEEETLRWLVGRKAVSDL